MGSPGWLWLVLGCAPAESEGLKLDWRWPAAGDDLPAHNRLLWVGLQGEAGTLEWRLDGQLLEGEEELERQVPVLHHLRPAPARSRLAVLSEARELLWLKKAARPIVAQPRVTEAAYKLKIIQDVYSLEDDSLRLVGRDDSGCGDCSRCAEACPTQVPLAEIGVDFKDCVQCLYCWWVCPKEALKLEGEQGHLARQVQRYKRAIETL
jgi:ferredoxin